MNCLKCGAEAPENQVFCDHCLSVMAQYPIKPGTPVNLPKRALTTEESKKPAKKKRTPPPEEQIAGLRHQILRLRLALVILIFLLCAVSGFLALRLYQDSLTPDAGRNYTIDTSMNN